jgi:hypothetical protein
MQITINYGYGGKPENATDVEIVQKGFFKAFPQFQNNIDATFVISGLTAKQEYQVAELLEKFAKKTTK